MKEIPLRGKAGAGMVALVDDEDYDLVKNIRWNLLDCNTRKYAHANIKKDGKRKKILLHRLIQKAPKEMDIDHINGCGIDCRKLNMRACNRQQNLQNKRKKLSKSSSKYKGVNWDNSRNKWESKIGYNYKTIHIGRFLNEIDAALAYDKKAIELFGEYARTNFTQEI